MSILDIHFHGTEKIDIKEVNHYEEILLIAEEAEKIGIDGFLLTLYPDSLDAMRKKLSIIKKAINSQTNGAKIYGAYLEGPFINPQKAGALDSKKFLMPDIDKLDKLIYGFEEIIKIITIAPELPRASMLIERCIELGIVVSIGHSDATYKQAEQAFKQGARLITHLFNAMRGIHHREPGIAGFGLINQEIYIELIGDGRHLNDEFLKWIFQIKNPKRIILISDMVKQNKHLQILQGGVMSLKDIIDRLKKLNINEDKLKLATENNPKELLQISSI